MSKRKSTKDSPAPPTYVMIDIARNIADDAYCLMTAAERGLDKTIESYLYYHGGRWKLDVERIRKLSNWDSKLCFDESLSRILKERYKVIRGYITRKDITDQIHRACNKRDLAQKAADTRWNKEQCDGNADALQTQCGRNAKESNESKERKKERIESKESKESNEPGQDDQTIAGNMPTSTFFRLYESIESKIKPKSKADQGVIQKAIRHVDSVIQSGQFNGESWNKLSIIVAESQKKNIKNRMAYFVGSVRNEFGEFQ